MLIAVARDIRVILIKLADRLHNMRTLSYLGEEKQLEKARETLEIYAPLAHRLGISQLKWELEDLAFQALEHKKYSQIQKMVAERRMEREKYVNELVEILRTELRKVGIKSEIQGRAKYFYSIYQKMVQQGKEFNEIYDLIAVRVLVDTVRDCYAALGVIHSLWKPVPGRFKDYIAMPKFNMYQSLHTTAIGPMGRPLEIQIRTKEMHRTAEYGIAAHWMYKEKGKEKGSLADRLAWFRQVLDWQKEMKDPREFMETLKIDLFQNEVFVFTPKGQVISLPAGSTPIDFAYTIHTDVGHRCVGARVNNRIVPLEYKLRNGDIIEILTSKTASGPSRDWLNIVKSSRARNKIRQWFSKESREDSEHLGKESLLRAIKKQGVDVHELTSSELMQTVVKDLNFNKLEDLYASVGTGRTSPQHVVTRLLKELSKQKQEAEPGPELEEEIPTVREEIIPVGVKVKGIEGVLTRLARCCNPVPRDAIVGFITRGRGISVHRGDCPNMKELLETPDRIIEVGWDTKQPATFPVEIQVEALDRTKLLRDISTVISDAGLNILSASVTTGRNQTAISRFVVEIGNIDHLQNILSNIKKIDAVYDAYRVLPKKSKQRSS
jgi:GTP pyrophosphokinase